MRRRRTVGISPWAWWLAFALAFGCRPSESDSKRVENPPWFDDATSTLGLAFTPDPGATEDYFMPRLTGGGAAFLDFDRDGDLDIYLVQNGGPESRMRNALFRQNGDHRFEDVSASSGLDVAGYGQGVAVGDLNRDGWPDIVVTEYGRVRLFLNRSPGTFREITDEADLENPQWATSAACFDYDRDGWLDVIVANYVEYNPDKACASRGGQRDFCGPAAFPGTTTRLFRNLGIDPDRDDGGVRFQDVTTASGLAAKPGPGLGVVCLDFDGDGWRDVFVANDGAANHLWMNQKDGTFVEEGVLRGIALNGMGQAEANMGVAVGDADLDGHFDIFVTHLGEESHRLWRQSPRGYFRDQTGVSGLAGGGGQSTGFGTVMADFDLDGDLDLVLVNGRVRRAGNDPPASTPANFWEPYRETNLLYANEGEGSFANRSEHEPALCGEPGVWRSVVLGDVDGDGALDLLVTRLDGAARVFRNTAPRKGNWLMIRAWASGDHSDAYDAEITVTAGTRRWTRWLNPGSSYVGSHDPRVHFGVGPVERVEGIQIRWPDGALEDFPGVAVNQMVTLRRGEGQGVEPSPESPPADEGNP